MYLFILFFGYDGTLLLHMDGLSLVAVSGVLTVVASLVERGSRVCGLQ